MSKMCRMIGSVVGFFSMTENPEVDSFALFDTSPLLRWDLATGATFCFPGTMLPLMIVVNYFSLRRHCVFLDVCLVW